LAADAVVRLASYYYKRKRYEISAEIFTKFQDNNPEHRLAAKSLTLAGLSHMKGEAFDRAMEVFEAVVRAYPDDKPVRSEAMYWLGDSAIQARAYADAYRAFKQLTWDYPETKWAKMARGRMTENVLLNAADTE
jgi:TolA-binding protein